MDILSHERTRELLALAQAGDEAAKETLVERNLGLVKAVAMRYAPRNALPFDDLYQLGCVGLLKSIMGFNLDFDVRFSTYAVPMIAGEMRRALRDDGMMRVSRSLKELGAQAAKATDDLQMELGRAPSVGEIADKLGVDPAELVQALEAQRGVGSLDESVYDDDSSTVGETVAAPIEDPSTNLLLKQLLEGLAPRERQVIVLRYYMDLTQNEVAKRMGISQVQVSRLESKILRRMREGAQETSAG